ncbi:hypothetical protein FNV43_RR21322 [Rhamnella rubrinervis]|uniref:Uncharacterized protein n=1 Tax=Rhamnella rubrinervis TaxID=2594499 RepID=A0A8K0E2X1_9ROSA|nr:hypothetical protein FNV43_RR21322 [Rhamnella rubrinervis]
MEDSSTTKQLPEARVSLAYIISYRITQSINPTQIPSILRESIPNIQNVKKSKPAARLARSLYFLNHFQRVYLPDHLVPTASFRKISHPVESIELSFKGCKCHGSQDGESCLRKRALSLCAADDAFLRQSYDASVHSANQLASRHERVRLQTSSFKPGDTVKVSDDSPPASHRGFTRKARTPHHDK